MTDSQAERLIDALEAIERVTSPGPSAECSTIVDQLCNITDHLQSIATTLENISQHLQKNLGS